MVNTGSELSLTWKEWDYMTNLSKDEQGNPPDFIKLGESDEMEDVKHPDQAEAPAETGEQTEPTNQDPEQKEPTAENPDAENQEGGGDDTDESGEVDEDGEEGGEESEDDEDPPAEGAGEGGPASEDAAGDAGAGDEKGPEQEATDGAEGGKENAPVVEVESYEELTVGQLREQLTLRGVDFPPRAVKADLIALLEAAAAAREPS